MGVLMAIEDCIQNPGVQVFIVGPDLKQTRRIVTPLINKIIADAPKGLIKQTKSELTWTIGESTLIIGAFDTALESMRGMEAYSMYLEESGLANMDEYEYILFSVLRPTLMHSRGRITHLTTPPKEENHPFVSLTLPQAEVNNALMVFTIEDNPLLTKEEIEDEIEALGGRSSPHVRRELFCEIVRDLERLIVPEFNEERHVREIKAPPYTYFLTSIDFGGARDNHALLLAYFDFVRNKYCILDEAFLEINTSTEEIVSVCRDLEGRNSVKWLNHTPSRVVDAPGQLHVDLKRMGLECVLPSKGKDSVEDGIQALRVAFLRDIVEIHPRCKHLIQTLKYGMWDKSRKDFQRTPALGHCDMLAALSYSFRHINRRSNPFPPTLGLHKDTHHFQREKQNDNEEVLNEIFFGD